MNSYLQMAINKQLEQKDIVIYNMILMLNGYFDTQDIDNPNFIDYICTNAGITEKEYRRIMKPLLDAE